MAKIKEHANKQKYEREKCWHGYENEEYLFMDNGSANWCSTVEICVKIPQKAENRYVT